MGRDLGFSQSGVPHGHQPARDVRSAACAFMGFDSAWTDNRKAPGAICSITYDGRAMRDFRPPQLVGFGDALSFIRAVDRDGQASLIALDQPTVVPNAAGTRPVEKVAARHHRRARHPASRRLCAAILIRDKSLKRPGPSGRSDPSVPTCGGRGASGPRWSREPCRRRPGSRPSTT